MALFQNFPETTLVRSHPFNSVFLFELLDLPDDSVKGDTRFVGQFPNGKEWIGGDQIDNLFRRACLGFLPSFLPSFLSSFLGSFLGSSFRVNMGRRVGKLHPQARCLMRNYQENYQENY